MSHAKLKIEAREPVTKAIREHFGDNLAAIGGVPHMAGHRFYITDLVDAILAAIPGPNPEWEAKAKAFHDRERALDPNPEPAQTLVMLRRWTADAEPANEHGQISFSRAMLESAADSLEYLLSAAYQARVGAWMLQCFTPEISEDRVERCDRFIEEALELIQACGSSAERAHAVVDYVFGRPTGEPSQEVGGVMVTLAALCNTFGMGMATAGEVELSRILHPDIMAKIRAKQAGKPTGSALPQ